jgi:hypothetical protein
MPDPTISLSCTICNTNSEAYIIMKEDDVLAIIEGQTTEKLAAIKRQDHKEEEVIALTGQR